MDASASGLNAVVQSLSLGGDGARVVVKDCINIAGYKTGCGSEAFAYSPAAEKNAAVIDSLLASNCHIVGKANMHELAFGMTGVNGFWGTPVNPLWPDRIPGGSSSGSAVATAAGLCDFAVGTDTGGSVRQPATCCGIYGIKPTFGRISRQGLIPASSSLDCIGVFARDIAMLQFAMQSIDPTFKQEEINQVPRLAWVQDEGDITVLGPLYEGLINRFPQLPTIQLAHLKDAFAAGMTVISSEAASAFGYLLDEERPIGADVYKRLMAARDISSSQVAEAEKIRTVFTEEVDVMLVDHDVLLMPALPVIPPLLKDAADPMAILPLTHYLRPFNLSGHPAITIPARSDEGLPIGLQIVGRKGDDEKLCAIAEWIVEEVPLFQSEVIKNAI